ncbi:hypothetical protein [Halovivax cerinus]|uniref:Uncharacterized protein n=1 Tax=Halovivax cerinus TaxID=1487865 RepID=A0ABD5NP99_9EURY|nr:hypothetical protein [Halovivax cerinus]
MKTVDAPTYGSLEQADTNNATIIWWHEKTEHYDPDDTWDDDRFPRRYEDWYQDKDLTNNGYKNFGWWNKPFYNWLENDRLIQACSSQLPLTQRERAHAKGLFHRLSGRKFGTYKETFAVVTCLYVVETSETDRRRGHPNVPEEEKPTEFRLEDVSQRFGVSVKWIRKAYARIERWVRRGDLRYYPEFDKYNEEFPLEYEHRVTELFIQHMEG